jgi:hypothetical protein
VELGEQQAEVASFAPVGNECSVFGGTAPVVGTPVMMTMYFYVFRVGATVVKLFAAQGVDGPPESLTPDVLAGIARRIVRRCDAV